MQYMHTYHTSLAAVVCAIVDNLNVDLVTLIQPCAAKLALYRRQRKPGNIQTSRMMAVSAAHLQVTDNTAQTTWIVTKQFDSSINQT
jgi:hypothetical protein